MKFNLNLFQGLLHNYANNFKLELNVNCIEYLQAFCASELIVC